MKKGPIIKVVGAGGSGVNTVSRMFRQGMAGIQLIAVNTDSQSLRVCPVADKILIGRQATQGLGAGMDVKLGEKAARENYDELKQALEGAQMIFLTCGLGGGSGTSGIAVLGEIAKSLGILTMAVVTLPFSFEGAQRKNIAQYGLRNLSGQVDCLLCIANDKLLALVQPETTIDNAFLICDTVLMEAVKGVSDLVSLPGIIQLDFADLRGVLENSGRAFLGIGKAKGEKRGMAAAQSALKSPLLDFSVKDSTGILLNIAGRDDLTLDEVNTAASLIKQIVKPRTKIVFGVSEDHSLKDGQLKVTLIATAKK